MKRSTQVEIWNQKILNESRGETKQFNKFSGKIVYKEIWKDTGAEENTVQEIINHNSPDSYEMVFMYDALNNFEWRWKCSSYK